MFERFTERARQIVILAQSNAHDLHHNYVGTEHILLGIWDEGEGVGARALVTLGVTHEKLLAEVKKIVGDDVHGEPETTIIPYTPRAKKLLEVALREALSLGHNYIGTEHILLAVVRTDESTAAQILENLGITPDSLRNEVIRMLSGPTKRTPAKPPVAVPAAWPVKVGELPLGATGVRQQGHSPQTERDLLTGELRALVRATTGLVQAATKFLEGKNNAE